MRASAVRTAIKTAIEAITPDTRYHAGDSFRVLEPGLERLTVDRAVMLERSRPQEPAERLLMTADPYAITFEMIVNFSNTPGVSDRLLDDCDLIVDALLELPVTNAQILQVKIMGGGDAIDETGNRAVIYSLTVFYDRRTPA